MSVLDACLQARPGAGAQAHAGQGGVLQARPAGSALALPAEACAGVRVGWGQGMVDQHAHLVGGEG